MEVARKDVGEVFQDGGGRLVQFLPKVKLKSDMFNENKSLLIKMSSSVNLNSELRGLGMGIKNEKKLYIMGLHWKI